MWSVFGVRERPVSTAIQYEDGVGGVMQRHWSADEAGRLPKEAYRSKNENYAYWARTFAIHRRASVI